MKKLVGGLLLLLACSAGAAYVNIATVGDGETLDLSTRSDVDFATNSITLQAGATLKLKTATLKAYLRVAGGSATVEAPDGVEAITLQGGLREVDAAAALLVKGAKSVTFGEARTDYAYWPMLDATNIVFEAADATGIALANRLVVRNVPARGDCSLSVASNAWLGFENSNTLARVVGTTPEALTDFTLDGWNLVQYRDAAFPANTKVTVKPGFIYALKPCSIDADNGWAGVRASVSTNTSGNEQWNPFTNVVQVALESDGTSRAQVMSLSVRELDIRFDVTGVGDFIQSGGALKGERMNVKSTLSFSGKLTLNALNAGVVVNAPTLSSIPVYLDATGARFQYWTMTNQVVSVGEIHTKTADQYLFMHQTRTWQIGTLSGSATIAGHGLSFTSEVSRLAAASSPTITGGAVLRLLNAEAGTSLKTAVYDSLTELVLDLRPFEGEAIPPVNVLAGLHLTVLGGAGKTLSVSGGGTVTAKDCAAVVFSAQSSSLEIPEGAHLTVTPAASLGSWTNKVAQWYDASVSSTLGGYPKNSDGTTVVYTNGYPIICRWGDRRYGTNSVHLFNGRSLGLNGGDGFKDRHDEVNPFVVKGGLNGKDYVSFGSCQQRINAHWQHPVNYALTGSSTTTEARRLHMVKAGTKGTVSSANTSLPCPYAILVFGSQQGGGAALFGTSVGERDRTVDKPFFKSGSWPMYVDGVATNGATACPNGGWQILSIPLGGKEVNTFGWNSAYNNAGGQNYAEIILFATAPTEQERFACERYLAEKWGLESSYKVLATPACKLTVNGKGTLTLAGDASLEGGFRGIVEVPAGKTLVLAGGTPVPGEEAVPSANRLSWFDPDAPNALRHATTSRPLNVSTLYPRTASGVVTSGNRMAGLTGGSDRCPWANASARGDGPMRTWLDFSNKYAEANGNTLRNQVGTQSGTDATSLGAVREGFIVLDTSSGGGTPLGVDVNCSTTARAASGRDASCPIWPKTSGVFTNVTTRLDDVVVKGTEMGFNARPEVLEFSFGAAWNPTFFGYYAHGNTTTGNAEIIGESIFYSQPLSAENRKKVTAYLAHKWFGKVLGGYTDLSQMTVAGAGRVEVASLAAVPNLAADFTGTVVPLTRDLTFTVDSRASRTAATNAWTACTLELLADSSVTVTVAAPLGSGAYTLISACTTADGQLPTLVLNDEADYTQSFVKDGVSKLELALVDGALKLMVPSRGTMVIFR